MPHFVHDFADQLAAELDNSRRELERVLDRTEALAELHSRALDLAAELKRPLTTQDLFQSGRNEKERAALRLLADRVAGDSGGNPAYDDSSRPVGHLETGAGF